MIKTTALSGVVFLLIVLGNLTSCTQNKIATRGTLAPDAKQFNKGIIQVYAARTKGVKRSVAVHTWISTKRSNDDHYTSYEIIGWKLRRHDSALVIRHDLPDRDWWGNQPELLVDYREADADNLINKIEHAVKSYPYKSEYQAYPGPNSNTFTAMIASQVPELSLDLPSTAIGKDYKSIGNAIGFSPSGTGVQASLFGMLGITLGYEEGLELNVLGLNVEFDIFDLAIELPAVGRIGPAQVTRTNETIQ
ncbi:DUF3750 domain-containing protein [Colwellia sp. 1_MG-2023]|uniref:DUF3750 domain-containing protein n=1 Tax=Colwellia sp. 1_MG-2023 TaxID=3062649 RepID=UPI0026E275E9|nr:DUF3750 domain-containing protein [Colwellia sp. 1_MG-2023]MDO6446837.1 DUF3750 domain-containing protein [Colwellia sp. 1_MG-2023]